MAPFWLGENDNNLKVTRFAMVTHSVGGPINQQKVYIAICIAIYTLPIRENPQLG